MYINKRLGALKLLAANSKTLLLVTVSAMTALSLEILELHTGAAMVVIGALSTAVSFFVAFFTAQAYDRWWEARKIWGTFVNDSRSFGRMVVTLFGKAGADGKVTALQKRLVRRHIAYLYAVKEHLRRESAREYLAQLSEEDGARIAALTHPGNAASCSCR